MHSQQSWRIFICDLESVITIDTTRSQFTEELICLCEGMASLLTLVVQLVRINCTNCKVKVYLETDQVRQVCRVDHVCKCFFFHAVTGGAVHRDLLDVVSWFCVGVVLGCRLCAARSTSVHLGMKFFNPDAWRRRAISLSRRKDPTDSRKRESASDAVIPP